ncbi:hypothetical protein EJB05_06670, partial [Eragrostis curvula]
MAERKAKAERLKAERRRLEAEAARIADALRQLDAEEEAEDEEDQDGRPDADADTTRLHPGSWGMLDSVIRDSAGGGTFVYASSSAAGDFVGISLCLLRPPATSHIHYCRTPSPNTSPSSSSDVSGPMVYYGSALATHHNMILLSFIIYTRPRNTRCEELFVYKASPNFSEESVVNLQASSLPMLVSVPSCGHTDVHQNMGILCQAGDHGEFVVAHLVVTPTEKGPTPKTDCPVTAELCCTVMDGHELKCHSTKPLQIHYHHGEGENLYWWHTDAVVPIDDKTICWVDYLRGILVCSDVLSPDPVLIYVQLPVDPYKDRENREMGTRGVLSSYRNVCLAQGGDVKFVDLSSFTFWFFGKPAKQLSISPYSAINTWTLSREKLLSMIKQRKAKSFVWVKDGALEDDEFIALTKSRSIPHADLEFPLVDIENPQIIYFMLGQSCCDDNESYLIAINMSTKRIDTSVRYNFGTSEGSYSATGPNCKPLYSCNVFYNAPFLCFDFSKY